MNSYTPFFSFVVDSSLWRESDIVVKIFLTMLAKKDRDHVVRGNAYHIAEWAKKTEAETIEALKVLSAPDTRRIEPQAFEGRRIEKTEGGYLILNGKFYQDLMRSVNRREYQRDKQAEYRANKKSMIPLQDIERRRTPEDQAKKAKYMFEDGQYPKHETALLAAQEQSAKETSQEMVEKQPGVNPPY